MQPIDIRSTTGDEELLTVSSKNGVVPRATAAVSMFQAESYVGHKLCWPGDLVINSLWAWGRGLGVARDHGIVSTAYGVYRTRPEAGLNPAYLHLLVRSAPFQWELQVRSQGVWKSRLQMTDARWLDAPLLVPSREEQAAIVKYLAHANARIEKAITAKRRLIALLEERKQVEVTSLFANLTPDNDVPVLPLKRLVRVRGGLTPSKEERGYWGGTVPWVSPKDMKTDVIVGSIDRITNRALQETTISIVPAGTVLVVVRGMILARRVPVAVTAVDVTVNQDMKALVPSAQLLPAYLQRLLSIRQPELRELVEVSGHGTRKLESRDLLTVGIPVPAIARQHELAEAAAALTSSTQDAIHRVDKEIRLLDEFRTRLVADVVTGQVDVREVAASLPEVGPEGGWGDSEGLDDVDPADWDDVVEAGGD